MNASSALPLRALGGTALCVHPLAVGCAPLASMPEAFTYAVAEETALRTLRAVFDGPINFLDTAASYGDGESERRIGLALADRGGLPAGFVLATKADRDLRSGDFSGDQMRRSVERSTRLLGLSRLQLVYLHDPEHIGFEATMAPNGPVEALLRLADEGVIEHLGVAGGPIDLMIRLVETGIFAVAISHNRFTLLDTSAEPFWDACRRKGVAAVNAAPYGGGILAQGPSAYPRYAYRVADAALLARARRLEEICTSRQVPLAAAALQFSLRDERITSTIVGVVGEEQLQATVDLARLPLPLDLWDELTAARAAGSTV